MKGGHEVALRCYPRTKADDQANFGEVAAFERQRNLLNPNRPQPYLAEVLSELATVVTPSQIPHEGTEIGMWQLWVVGWPTSATSAEVVSFRGHSASNHLLPKTTPTTERIKPTSHCHR